MPRAVMVSAGGAETLRHAPWGPAMLRLLQPRLALAARGWRGAAGQTPLLPHTPTLPAAPLATAGCRRLQPRFRFSGREKVALPGGADAAPVRTES